MKKTFLRKQVIDEFRHICSGCDEICCMKQKAFSVFRCEALKAPKLSRMDAAPGWGSSCGVRHNSLKGGCAYSSNELKSCELTAHNRPLDCICYPFYPSVKEEDGALTIDGLFVHKSCGHAGSFARNKRLAGLLKKLFEHELLTKPRKTMIFWLKPGQRYWNPRKTMAVEL